MLVELECAIAARQQLRQSLLAVFEWRVPQIVTLQFDQVERDQGDVMIAAAGAQGIEIGQPIVSTNNASPSIRNDCDPIVLAASTMAGKRSAQSYPPRVHRRTRAPLRRFGRQTNPDIRGC